MRQSFVFLSALLAVVTALPSFNRTDASVGMVAATWYAGWHAELYPLSNVSWDKYTHITYSFAETTNDVSKLDLSGSAPGVLPEFVKTARAKGVKALVSVGGWTGSRFYSSNVGNAKNRTAFVKTITSFATKYELDGIDFDWEYPVNQGLGCNIVSPSDTTNFLSFLKELRQDPKGSKLILTAATPIGPWPDKNGDPADLTEFSTLLDYVAIMNYDIWGGWSTAVGPNAPLDDSCAPSEDQQGSAVTAIEAWTGAGIPAYQIVLGVPAYGHSFKVKKSVATGGGKDLIAYPTFESGQPQGDPWDDQPGVDACGVQAGYGGVWNFWGLVEGGFLKQDGSVNDGIDSRFDSCSQTPFVYNSTSEIMISYDNAQSFQAKGNFIKSKGLRGFAIWEAAGDYKDILLDAVREGAGFEEPDAQC